MLWLLSFCLSGAAAAFDHAEVARQTLENHIRPGYRRLAETASALQLKTTELCRAPSIPAFAETKKVFVDTVLAWSRIEHIRFGPVRDENRLERMAFWPDPKGIGRKQIAKAIDSKNATVQTAQALAVKSTALQGLTALEWVLYGTAAEALTASGENGAFRCTYALAIAENISAMSRDIDSAWRAPEGFPKLFLSPGEDNPAYLQPSEVTHDLVQAYATGLRTARDLKLAGPLGFRKGRAVPEPAAYAKSGLDRAVITANIEGVRDLFVGGGLAAQLAAENEGMDKSVLTELDLAAKTLQGLRVPLAEAAKNANLKGKLAVAGFQLKNAIVTGGGQLSTIAGLSLGFNALDGD